MGFSLFRKERASKKKETFLHCKTNFQKTNLERTPAEKIGN